MRLNSFSLQKKFSIKCRHLYISRSMSSGVERRGCWAMTALAPRSFRSATMSLLSNAVSPISAPKASPSMSGGTPTVSKRCLPWQEHNAHKVAERVGERQDLGGQAAFGPADGLAQAWRKVPLLRPVRDDGP